MNISDNEQKLEKSIGFWGLLAMSVGINIGGSLFALTGLAAGYSGPSLPIAMLISATPVMLAMIPFCILSIAHPTTSGSYRYSQLVNPTAALVYVLTSIICICIGGMPLFALIAGIGLEPILGFSPTVSGVLLLSVFYVINVLGVTVLARIQLLLSIVLLLALAMFITSGLPHISSVNFSPLLPNGFSGTLVAAGLLFTFCAGGLFIVDLGGEVTKAEKNLPRAITAGMLIALLIYLGIMLVTIGAVDWTTLKGQTLVSIAGTFLSPGALTFFIIGGAVLASATTINTVFAVQARLILVVSEETFISPWFSKINDRFGTPHRALTLIYVVSVVSLVAIPSLKLFGSLLNFTMIIAVTMVTLASIKVAKNFPHLCKNSSLSIAPSTVKTIGWTIVSINSLIIVFFAFYIGAPSLVFIGILAAVFCYTMIHKGKLKNVAKQTVQTWSAL